MQQEEDTRKPTYHHQDVFPDDILYQIFSYSLLPIIQFHYSLVCKQWYHLTNHETFYRNYYNDAIHNGLNNFLNPTHSDRMKYLFDWTEFVSHLHPEHYEALQQLKKNIRVEDVSEWSDSEFASRYPEFSNNSSRERKSKRIIIENGTRTISFFVWSSRYDIEFLALAKENPVLESVDHQQIQSKPSYTMFVSYSRRYDEYTLYFDKQWFLEQLKTIISSVGEQLFLNLIEFLVPIVSSRKDCYVCDYDPYFVRRSKFCDDARRIKSFMIKDTLLKSVLTNCNEPGAKRVWHRLLDCGYRFVSEKSLHDFFFHNDQILGSTDRLQFLFDYCKYCNMEHVAETLINDHIVEIIEKRANLCQVLIQNNFKYRKDSCQNGEACGFSSLQVQDHDSILDIQAARKKFFSKFVLTEDVLRRGRVDTQRIIVVYYSKLEQQKFTIFFRKHYPLLQDRHYLIPKKSTTYKDEFVTSEILENCDIVVFCVFTIPDEDHASKYREALQMLKSKKKRVLFGCRKSKSLSRVTLYHPDIEIIRLRKDPVSTALLLDYTLLGTNGI